MNKDKFCHHNPKCDYLHQNDDEIQKWKKSIDYKAFELTYEYFKINEKFRWETEWRHIRIKEDYIMGRESLPLKIYINRTNHQSVKNNFQQITQNETESKKQP